MSVNRDYYVIAGYDLTGCETDTFEDWKWSTEGEKFHCYQRKGQVQLFYDPMGDSHLYFGYILAHGDEYECPTGKINVSEIEEVKSEVENKFQELINQGAISEGCKPYVSYQILAFEECS